MSGTEPAASAAAVAVTPCFSLASLICDLGPHPELDVDTLAHHLTQSDATAAEGHCHAAVNEARSFLEGLLVGILHAAGRLDTDSAAIRRWSRLAACG